VAANEPSTDAEQRLGTIRKMIENQMGPRAMLDFRSEFIRVVKLLLEVRDIAARGEPMPDFSKDEPKSEVVCSICGHSTITNGVVMGSCNQLCPTCGTVTIHIIEPIESTLRKDANE
jgi:hypothetical protein